MNTIAFWNVNGRPNLELLSRLCADTHIDILVLAEIGRTNPIEIADALSIRSERVYSFANPLSFRVKVFSSIEMDRVVPVWDSQYFSAMKVSPPLGPDYLLVGVHLPSKMSQEGSDQAIIAQRVSVKVGELERNHNISRTIVLGDFNMNPFEHGLVNADGFHAVMDRSIAERRTRTVLFEDRQFFYNPMWSLHGDISTGPSGSYYYQASNPICYFWNLFDQAIFRPCLLTHLPPTPVVIVERIGDVELLAQGVPDHNISDHLPIKILFKSDNEVSNG